MLYYRCDECFHVQSEAGSCDCCSGKGMISIHEETLTKLEFISDALVAAGCQVYSEAIQEGFKIIYDGSGTAIVNHSDLDSLPEHRSIWQMHENNMNQKMYGALSRFGTEEVFWLDTRTDCDGFKVTQILVRLVRLMVPKDYTIHHTL